MKIENEKLVLLLNISNNYGTGMSIEKAVCRAWKGKPSRDVDYVLAIAHGEVKGMFRMSNWHKDNETPDRWAFDAKEATIDMLRKYEDKRFRMYGPMEYTKFI